MSELKPVLAAALGVGAAIPGIAELRALEFPGTSETLFQFVLAAFSAAVVLAVYVNRDKLRGWPFRRVLVVSTVAALAVIGLFFFYVLLSSKVMVIHSYRGEPETAFVPLFLSGEAEALIQQAGSRSQLLTTEGVDALQGYYREADIGATLVVLLAVYTALVLALATLFGILGIRAMPIESPEPVPQDAAVSPSSEAPEMIQQGKDRQLEA